MLQYVDADKCLLTASWDRSVCIHDDMDNDEGVVLRTMKGHGKDVTCAAASFALKLMASSGADGHILVWNYAMGNLEGMCKGHAQDVTALEFLEPYPVLVSADILGNVVLWGMPPGPPEHRFKPMVRFKNILLMHVYSVVLAVSWFPRDAAASRYVCDTSVTVGRETPLATDPSGFSLRDAAASSGKAASESREVLVTGDESGQLKVRSIAPLIQRFALKPAPAAPAPSLTELRLRRRGLTQIPLPPAPKQGQSFQDTARGPGMALSDDKVVMPVIRQWQAHDSVRCLSPIRSKHELISTGFDHLVRIWSLDGQLLGTLRQGQTLEEEWLFQPSTDKKIEALNLEASEVVCALCAALVHSTCVCLSVSLSLCMCVCSTYVCMFIHVCMYVCMHACICLLSLSHTSMVLIGHVRPGPGRGARPPEQLHAAGYSRDSRLLGRIQVQGSGAGGRRGGGGGEVPCPYGVSGTSDRG